MLSPSEVALGPVAARVLVHEVARKEELAKRRCAHNADYAGLEEHRAWYVFVTQGFVVKHVDAAELRVVVATVHAVAADALHVHNLSRRSSLEAGSTRHRKGGEERRNVRNSLWQFGTGNRNCRWNAREYPKQENEMILQLLSHEPWAPCKERSVWANAVIFASAMCSLQFAKASAATLLQQENIDSAYVQRGRLNAFYFICTVATRAGQRAARREAQKHKPTTANDPRTGLGEKRG